MNEPVFARPSEFRRSSAKPELGWAWASTAGWVVTAAVVMAYTALLIDGSVTVLGVVVVVGVLVTAGAWMDRVGRLVPSIDLAGLLRLSLALKFLFSVPRYQTRIDANVYHRAAIELADSFRRLDFFVDTQRQVPGTGSVRYLAGLVEVVTLEDESATFALFSLLGFVGIVAMVVAVALALPAAASRFAPMVLLWPSLLYWPTGIGKESILVGALGVSSLGLARLFVGSHRGLLLAVLGLGGAAMVRPHVALIFVVAAACAAIIGSGRRIKGGLLTRIAIVLILVVMGALASTAVESLFDIDNLDGAGVSAVLDEAENRSTQGGSGFEPARIDTVLDWPKGFVTVVFRPFPWEATSYVALATSLEGVVLFVLTVLALPRLRAAVPAVRKEPFAVLCLSFVIVFVYLFSAIGNFGILTRQRSMMLPFYLVILALPTLRDRVRLRRSATITS